MDIKDDVYEKNTTLRAFDRKTGEDDEVDLARGVRPATAPPVASVGGTTERSDGGPPRTAPYGPGDGATVDGTPAFEKRGQTERYEP